MIDINNPGNLRPLPNGQTWNGQTGVFTTEDGKYCIFSTDIFGLRALCKNLMAYRSLGANTILKVFQIWAPAADHNDPSGYATFVANSMGIKITTIIDIDSPDFLFHASKAISIMENGWDGTEGQYWYTDAVYHAGVAAALDS